MIEVEISRSGHKVLKKNGRWLASSVDPLREAATWAEKHIAGISPSDTVFILGLGSGFHVAALQKLLPRNMIVTVESDAELAAQARQTIPDLINTGNLIVEPVWSKLIEIPIFRDGISGVYHILIHGPSAQCNPEYYNNVANLLRGRDQLSLLLLLKTRPELLALFDQSKLSEIGVEPVSIKTFKRLFQNHAGGNRERRLWRLLEELVV